MYHSLLICPLKCKSIVAHYLLLCSGNGCIQWKSNELFINLDSLHSITTCTFSAKRYCSDNNFLIFPHLQLRKRAVCEINSQHLIFSFTKFIIKVSFDIEPCVLPRFHYLTCCKVHSLWAIKHLPTLSLISAQTNIPDKVPLLSGVLPWFHYLAS